MFSHRDYIILFIKFIVLLLLLVFLVKVLRYYFVDMQKFTTFDGVFDILNGLSFGVAYAYGMREHYRIKEKLGKREQAQSE